MTSASCPFNTETVAHAFDPSAMAYIEMASDSSIYGLAADYIAKHVAEASPHSRRVQATNASCDSHDTSDSEDEDSLDSDMSALHMKQCARPTALTIGLGLFSFTFGGEESLHALHETVGEPVANGCGSVEMFTRLVLFAPKASGGLELLQSFCDKLIADSERTRKDMFSIYRFDVRRQYWRREVRAKARPIESVVLPGATKDKLVADIDNFLSPKTAKWYGMHGVPYRRSYLFHGVPGSGKTSLLQAVAGKYERNLCFLAPAHPDVTDDMLKTAVQNTPAKSLLVLEDIDALFEKDRTPKVSKSPLTFSGLLNALDGVGASKGSLIVLTSNFRDRLDAALIRPGRVDLHVEFGHATGEQMSKLFGQFYPRAPSADAALFAERTLAVLDGRSVAMCALQHYFITSRTRSAAEAIEHVEEIAEELTLTRAEAASPAADGKESTTEKKATTSKERPKKPKGAAPPPPVHVHVHLGGANEVPTHDGADGCDGDDADE